MDSTHAGKELAEKFSESVGCNIETSKSNICIINKYTSSEIVDIYMLEPKSYKKMVATDLNGEKYTVFLGITDGVEEIYRGDEKGERLFRAIV